MLALLCAGKISGRRAAGIITSETGIPDWKQTVCGPHAQQRMELYAPTSMQPSSTIPTWPPEIYGPAKEAEWKQVCKTWPNIITTVP